MYWQQIPSCSFAQNVLVFLSLLKDRVWATEFKGTVLSFCTSEKCNAHLQSLSFRWKPTVPPSSPLVCAVPLLLPRGFSFLVFSSLTVPYGCRPASSLYCRESTWLHEPVVLSLTTLGNWLQFVPHGFFSLFPSPTLFLLSARNTNDTNFRSFVVPQVQNTLFISPSLSVI